MNRLNPLVFPPIVCQICHNVSRNCLSVLLTHSFFRSYSLWFLFLLSACQALGLYCKYTHLQCKSLNVFHNKLIPKVPSILTVLSFNPWSLFPLPNLHMSAFVPLLFLWEHKSFSLKKNQTTTTSSFKYLWPQDSDQFDSVDIFLDCNQHYYGWLINTNRLHLSPTLYQTVCFSSPGYISAL